MSKRPGSSYASGNKLHKQPAVPPNKSHSQPAFICTYLYIRVFRSVPLLVHPCPWPPPLPPTPVPSFTLHFPFPLSPFPSNKRNEQQHGVHVSPFACGIWRSLPILNAKNQLTLLRLPVRLLAPRFLLVLWRELPISTASTEIDFFVCVAYTNHNEAN